MRRLLLEMFESTGQLDPQAIVLRMVVATIIAFFIYLSYKLSHEGSIYSKKFNVSLMALTVITTAVMIVIGNNIALSLGMVGALSIVRFRTAIKDSRDTIYIFWTIVAGICCGAGDFLVAAVGSAFAFLVLLIFGRIKNARGGCTRRTPASPLRRRRYGAARSCRGRTCSRAARSRARRSDPCGCG